eukprot:5008428-Pyramimonas_sp.AAC.1
MHFVRRGAHLPGTPRSAARRTWNSTNAYGNACTCSTLTRPATSRGLAASWQQARSAAPPCFRTSRSWCATKLTRVAGCRRHQKLEEGWG